MVMSNKGIPDFAKIKETVSFEDLLKHYGLLEKLKRKGDQLTGPCPIHQGDGKSCFSVNLAKSCFNCFSCKAHGNTLDFVVFMEKVELKEAGILLSEWFNVPLETKHLTRKTGQGEERKETLVKEKEALPHHTLLDNRGRMTGGTTEESAGSPEPVNPPLTFELKNLDQSHPYFKERGLKEETIKFFTLGYCSRGLQKGRIVIPIHTEKGELVAYAGRWPGNDFPDKEGKYKLPPNKFKKSCVVFNLHRAKEYIKDKELIIVEGYFSVFRLWQAGFPNVVALMGSSLSKEQEELIIKAVGSAGKVILLFDNDEAGNACEEDALKRLSRKCFVGVASLPDGKELDKTEEEEIKAFLNKGKVG